VHAEALPARNGTQADGQRSTPLSRTRLVHPGAAGGELDRQVEHRWVAAARAAMEGLKVRLAAQGPQPKQNVGWSYKVGDGGPHLQ
jgi:hypothetical protein